MIERKKVSGKGRDKERREEEGKIKKKQERESELEKKVHGKVNILKHCFKEEGNMKKNHE